MYLKELQVFGFKSFPQKTTLKFEPAITAIVGPNGCGKSNILDALKWALGEQSPKSLRASKMEDVIFGGTENFPPLNYAEVTLLLSNEDKYLPIDYNEVSICRRLYRSGESEYFINKNPVRLKDIQDLFASTGIGETAYSFIEQGKVEALLNYKPEDKRLIFDVASGVITYKERKKETLKRLEETEENLLRIEDIIGEVNRQIRYLEKQVEKTKKYKEMQEELIQLEKKIATIQFKDLDDKINKLLEELNELKSQEDKKNKALAEVKFSLETLNSQILQIHSNLEEIDRTIISLNAKIQNSNNNISFYERSLMQLRERNNFIATNKKQLGERLVLQENRIIEERKNIENINKQIELLEVETAKLKYEKENLEKEVKNASKQIETDKTKIFELEAKKVQLHNEIVEIQTNLTSLVNRKKRLLLDKKRLEDFIDTSSQNLKIKQEQLSKINDSLSHYQNAKINLSNEEKDILKEKENLNSQLIESEKELVQLRSYYDFLKELHIKYESFSTKTNVTILFDEEPKNINKLLVSLKGITFYKEGNYYKATVQAKIILLEEAQLEEKINFINDKISKINETLKNLDNKITLLNNQLAEADSSIVEYQRKKDALLGEIKHLQDELARINEEVELVNSELANTSSEIGNLEDKRKKIDLEINNCEEEVNKTNLSIKSAQDFITKGVDKIKIIDIEMAKGQVQKSSLYKEKESLNSKITILEEEENNILNNLKQLEEEEKQNIFNIEKISKDIEILKATIKETQEKINQYLQKKETFVPQQMEYSKKIEEKKNEIETLEKNLGELQNLIYNKKLNIQSLEYEREKIKDYIRQVYNIEFEVLSYDTAIEDLSVCLEKKQALKRKIDNLGEVNLVAVEEFEELNKRQNFLNQQKQDLISSKEELKKAIQKINRTSKEIFLETFKKIEEEFKNNFRFLFGGGRASLVLLDPENVLESGVEIEVQPPGKKLQNVSLLSGGEKALTAIALIFAIFKIRPSPVCVLDEIDAPLDEANVDRFIHLLKQFAKNSQFLVITHNKKTMSCADILYGVTMQEKGISKLVSVKFAETKNKEETAQHIETT
ncbi:MAG: AAA family ATPase [Candidatus Omnitrophica bacterium]|nr:AAA family ATPase [Candidatus Omnitrophota bacterium]